MTILRTTRRDLLKGAAAASLGVFPMPAIAQGTPLKIGFMLPYTGTFAKLGKFIDDAFRRQADIDRASGSPQGPGAEIGEIAKGSGLAADKAMACLDAPSLIARLDAVHKLAEQDKVEGTPTLVLAGATLEDGYDDYAKLRALIDKAIAAAR